MDLHCRSSSVGTNLKIGTCRVKQSNGRDRAPPGVQGYGQGNSWLVESMKELSRQQSLDMDFRDCQLRALQIVG